MLVSEILLPDSRLSKNGQTDLDHFPFFVRSRYSKNDSGGWGVLFRGRRPLPGNCDNHTDGFEVFLVISKVSIDQ